MKMEHLFLNKDLSLKAKELGFDERCFRYFYPEAIVLQGHIIAKEGEVHETTLANGYQGYGNKSAMYGEQGEERCNIPLYQQIISFLNKLGQERDIDIYIIYDGLNLEKTDNQILEAMNKL